jgi:hypothetical protein
VKVVLEMNPSASAAATVSTLEYISDTYGGAKGAKLRKYVDEVLEWAFALTMGKGIPLNNLVAVADAVKGMLNASLNKSPDLMHIRKYGDQLVRMPRTRNPTWWSLVNVRRWYCISYCAVCRRTISNGTDITSLLPSGQERGDYATRVLRCTTRSGRYPSRS